MHIEKTLKTSEDTLNYQELWETLLKRVEHVVNDNNLYSDKEGLPQSIRQRQTDSIKTLIKEIEKCHVINSEGYHHENTNQTYL